MTQQLRVLVPPPEDTDSISSTPMIPHNYLWFQFKEPDAHFWPPQARYVSGAQTYRQNTHAHKIIVLGPGVDSNFNFKILNYIEISHQTSKNPVLAFNLRTRDELLQEQMLDSLFRNTWFQYSG